MKVYLGGVRYIIKDTDGVYEPKSVKFVEQRVPVSTGGSFNLSNGDTLHINEEYGEISPWSDYYTTGIWVWLESGDDVMTYYSNYEQHHSQSSMYGMTFDLDGMYNDGDVLKIYILPISEIYENDNHWGEDGVSQLTNNKVFLQIQNGYWVMIEPTTPQDTRATGYEFLLNNGQTLFISDFTCVGWGTEGGVYYTLSSGEQTIAFYYDGGGAQKAETSYNWLAPYREPLTDDYINIYFGNNMYDIIADNYSGYYSESNVAEIADYYVQLYYDGGWFISNDNS